VLHWLGFCGLNQEVLALRDRPIDLEPQLRSAARWYHALSGMPAGKAKFPWMALRVRRICSTRQPDVVICWHNGFSSAVLLGARLAGVRCLLTHGGNPPTPTLGGKLYTAYTTFMLSLAGAKMVCCSRYVEREFASLPGVCATVLTMVLNCIPVSRITAKADEARRNRVDTKRRIIMVATLEPHKDHATLLRAMVHVRRAIPEVELLLAGNGSLRERLERVAFELGVAESVRFLGTRSDGPSLLGESDLFVFSTTPQEGLPGALLEALAANIPIVASDVPPCREVLNNGTMGTMVIPGNPQALAAAIIQQLEQQQSFSDPATRDAYLKKFTVESMINGYLEKTEIFARNTVL